MEPLSPSENGAADVTRVSDVAVASRDDVPAVGRPGTVLAWRDSVSRMPNAYLAATELATNLAQYAAGGNIHISLMDDGARTVLQLESSDTGPGIPTLSKPCRMVSAPAAAWVPVCPASGG